jgi:hypothetical protein
MVHVMHRFGSFLWDRNVKWCTWYTILALFGGTAALNGARDAPFWLFFVGWRRQMAHVMHHFGSFSQHDGS